MNKYWLQVNKSHRELKWMSYDDWDPETSDAIASAVKHMKSLLDILTQKVEKK